MEKEIFDVSLQNDFHCGNKCIDKKRKKKNKKENQNQSHGTASS